jgi:transcriptional regulator GlxA family with amidase domain
MEAFMPKPVAISIFFHARTQPSYALLAASVFRLANRLSGDTVFDARLVGESHRFRWQDGEIKLQPINKVSDGYLIIPPMDATQRTQKLSLSEIILLRHSISAGATIATACLGAFLPAEAGLLDGREATTHWDYADFATRNYPAVHWNTREMLVDHGDVITAGGLLSIVDLCLHIVRKTQGGTLAQSLGQTLLADTVRQKQSVYATRLVAAPRDATTFEALEREIDRRGGDGLTVPDMAAFCNMSLRSFHRRFQDNYGVTPIKFLQLRRIEAAKAMLAQKQLSLDTVAERAGFSDMAFFRSVFSRETGMTPGQYRRNMVETA